MFHIEVNQEELKQLYLEKVEERMKEIEQNVFFMDSKQLCKFVGMSWNSVNTHLMSDRKFPKIRLGHKWLFPRLEVVAYMQKYYEEVRDGGGDIISFKRK